MTRFTLLFCSQNSEKCATILKFSSKGHTNAWLILYSFTIIADMIIKVGEEGPLLIELSYFLSDQNPEDLQSDSSVTLKSISQSDSIC